MALRSFKFPKMFNTNSSNIWRADEYDKATSQNLRLLLLTTRGSLFCDPYFGLLTHLYLFDQNNTVLRDRIIDMLYTQIAYFMPQLSVRRSDVKLITTNTYGELYCKFIAQNKLDATINTYNIKLLGDTIEW